MLRHMCFLPWILFVLLSSCSWEECPSPKPVLVDGETVLYVPVASSVDKIDKEELQNLVHSHLPRELDYEISFPNWTDLDNMASSNTLPHDPNSLLARPVVLRLSRPVNWGADIRNRYRRGLEALQQEITERFAPQVAENLKLRVELPTAPQSVSDGPLHLVIQRTDGKEFSGRIKPFQCVGSLDPATEGGGLVQILCCDYVTGTDDSESSSHGRNEVTIEWKRVDLLDWHDETVLIVRLNNFPTVGKWARTNAVPCPGIEPRKGDD